MLDQCGFREATMNLVQTQCRCSLYYSTWSYNPFSLLTLLSSGSLKLWLFKDEELCLVRSGCWRFPSTSWFPSLSPSTSWKLSFFRLALWIEPSSAKRLTPGSSDGDLSVATSGLWISEDEGEEPYSFCLIVWIKNSKKKIIPIFKVYKATITLNFKIQSHFLWRNMLIYKVWCSRWICYSYFEQRLCFLGDSELFLRPTAVLVFWEKKRKEKKVFNCRPNHWNLMTFNACAKIQGFN